MTILNNGEVYYNIGDFSPDEDGIVPYAILQNGEKEDLSNYVPKNFKQF